MAIMVFDAGGSSIKVGYYDQQLHLCESIVTPKTYDAFKDTLSHALAKVQAHTTIEAVSFSLPGAVNQQTGIIGGMSAIPYIHHFNIVADLEKFLGLPVFIENDANAAALAEVGAGSAKGLQNVLCVILGTGVGGAMIIDGQVIHGKNSLGGEFGYIYLDNQQTFSELATAVAMEKRYQKRLHLETRLSAQTIFDLAKQGDAVAYEEVEKCYHYIAMGLYNLRFCYDPEVILIGGGLSNRDDLLENIQRHVKLLRNHQASEGLPLAICAFKSEANLIGAYFNALGNHR